MSLNVSLGELEEFVREKVARGEYETASEVVCDALRLLKRREELWRAKLQTKIAEGMACCRTGRTIQSERAWIELRVWRDQQKRMLQQ